MSSEMFSNHYAWSQALAHAISLQSKQHVMHHTTLTYVANALLCLKKAEAGCKPV